MENKNVEATIGYMAHRQWRSSIFFNLSVLIFGVLVAKVATNFASGQPGLAGFRVFINSSNH